MAVTSETVLFSKKILIIKVINNVINNDDEIILCPTYQSIAAKIFDRFSYISFRFGNAATNASLITLELFCLC